MHLIAVPVFLRELVVLPEHLSTGSVTGHGPASQIVSRR